MVIGKHVAVLAGRSEPARPPETVGGYDLHLTGLLAKQFLQSKQTSVQHPGWALRRPDTVTGSNSQDGC